MYVGDEKMIILAINAGSSSLKFTGYRMPEEEVLISGVFQRIGIDNSFYTIKINGEKFEEDVDLPDHKKAVEILLDELIKHKVVNSLDEIEAVGHRVVHGGEKYSDSVVVTEDVKKIIDELSDIAPLHNPANLMGIEVFEKMLPHAKNVAVFDTAFHQTMATDAYLYAVPYEWYTNYGVRKYGFHGTSHKYLSQRLSSILGRDDCKIITCHLGNGGSISAIKDGKCVDTSMGFTPNAGIVMGSRSGDIDVSIIPYVMKKTGENLDEIMNDLNKKSGFLGISGVSSDSRDVEIGINAGNPRCILAQSMYINTIVQYIASYYALLGGCDAICFAGGIGENSINTRKEILEALEVFGIKCDYDANNCRGKEVMISTKDSKIPCYVIPTDEEVMIARDTYNLTVN